MFILEMLNPARLRASIMKSSLLRVQVLIMAGAMIAVLAACGGDDPTPTPTEPPAPTATATVTPLPTATPRPGVTPRPTATPPPSPTPLPAEIAAYQASLTEFEQVEAAARQEGKLVIYTSPSRSEPITTLRLEAFNKRYPEIEVDVVGVSNSGHLERIRAETALSRREGDIGESGATVIFVHWDEGHTINYIPPALIDPDAEWAVFPKVAGMDSGVLFSRLLVYGIFVNTDLVSEGDEPKSYADLLDPKWEGEVAFRDPSRRGGGNHIFSALRQYYSADFMRSILANSTIIAASSEVARTVARGDHSVSAPINVGNLVALQDAPVKLIIPAEGALSILSGGLMIYKDAPHPNAAKVWTNFWLTKEGQDVFGLETTPFLIGADIAHPLLDPTIPRIPLTPFPQQWASTTAIADLALANDILKELGKR